MTTSTAELVLQVGAVVGEGPVWDERQDALWWVDIEGRTLHRWEPTTGRHEAKNLGQRVGCAVPCEADGVFVVALQTGFALLDWKTGALQPILDPEADLPDNRFNDGKCDPRGRLWAGTMSLAPSHPWTGALYSLSNHGCVRQLTGIGISNGLAWSSDERTMYYIDSLTGTIDAFDFAADEGVLRNRRVVYEVPAGAGSADGMTMDTDGCLWVAFWGGWGVARVDPRRGRVLERIRLPVSHAASCTFGGARFDELYITTATQCLSAAELNEQPHAGDVFVARTGTSGLPVTRYSGGRR